jgi:hypothetical protein
MAASPPPALIRRLVAIVGGGATAGLVDLGAASLIYGMSLPAIMRVIAGGVLGKAASDGGTPEAALGAALQVLIGMIYAAIFSAASVFLPVLLRRPILFGAPFGAMVFFSMRFVVVPLSNAPHGKLHLTLKLAEDFASNCLFGVIIALWASILLRPRPAAGAGPAETSAHAFVR